MISVIITAHDEPLHMIRRAIGSALPGAAEVLVVMPERRGAEARQLEAEKVRTVLTHRRGVASKRNEGVAAARSEFVAFLDADDLFGLGSAWLWRAHAEALCHEGDVVVHPQVSVYFGDEAAWFQHVDQRSKSFDPMLFFDNNYWTSHFLTRRSTMLKWPMLEDFPGFALEDWAWHRDSVASGALHVVAAKTVTFVRKRKGSRNAQAAAQKLLPIPGEFLNTRTWALHPKTATEDLPAEDLAHADWLLAAWRSMNVIEPELWPSPKLTAKAAFFEPASARAGQSVAQVIEALRPYDRLILTPWLTHGGADLQVRAYAEAVQAAHPGKCAIVLTDPKAKNTDDAAVPVVRLASLVKPEHAPIALLYALVSRCRYSLHVVNSELGYVLMREHGAAIKQYVQRAFASLFCVDYSLPSRRRGGYAFDGTFTRCAEHFDRVLTDNVRVTHELARIGIVDVTVARIPVESPTEPVAPRAPVDAPVLWASRLDAQKGVLLLRTIAADNPARTFCVVGAPLMQSTPAVREAVEALERLPNVLLDKRAWARTSESLARLFDPSRYACLLYTGQWDGTPNVVLESLAHGLPVVSTDVGDVDSYTEFVNYEQDDTTEWRDLLALASACSSESASRVVASHTRAAFEAALRKVDYL